jgi:hypothetical protein
MLTCLLIGHTRLTHGYLLRGEPAPFYINCDVPHTVLHILVDCPYYGEASRAYQLQGALSDILGDDRRNVSSVSALIQLGLPRKFNSISFHINLCCSTILTFTFSLRRHRDTLLVLQFLAFQEHLHCQALLQSGKLGFDGKSLRFSNTAVFIATPLADIYTALPVVVAVVTFLLIL